MLLQLDFVFVAVPVLAFAVTRLVELNVGGFTVELYILQTLVRRAILPKIKNLRTFAFFFPTMIGDFK